MQLLLSFAAHSRLLYVYEIIKFYYVTIWLMNSQDDGIGHNKNNNNSRTKAIAAVPMAGIVVTAALLSGLSLLSNYQEPAIAQQQNMTATNATATNATATNATATNATATNATATNATATNATATNATAIGGGQVSEEEGGRIELEEERAEGEDESPGQSIEQEEQG
jgi:hypothetical protein